MTLFRATAAGPDRSQPAAPTPLRQDRADGVTSTTAGSPPPGPAMAPTAAPAPETGPWPELAMQPTMPELAEHLASMLVAVPDGIGPDETARLARQLQERVLARIAGCRDAVITGPLAVLQPDQLARLRAIAPAPGQMVEPITPELDHGTLLALLDVSMPGPAGTVMARLAATLEQLQPALMEAALDALHRSTALDRFDRICRMHYAQAFARALPDLGLPDPVCRLAQQALARQEDETQRSAPHHREASEALLVEALCRGDNGGAIQILAAAALVPVTAIETAIALRSRRGMISLAWKAGYSMRAAVLIQSQLGGIAPDRVLMATPDGGCPLSRGEIMWQIGFLARRLG